MVNTFNAPGKRLERRLMAYSAQKNDQTHVVAAQLAKWSIVLSSALAGLAGPLRAEVTRFEIHERTPFAGGQSFGEVGAYEQIIGTVHYAIDPHLRQNQAIVDRHTAAVNAEGRVEFSADLYLLAPVELTKGNGALLYDVNNRGNKLALRFLSDASGGNRPLDAGNGFLMRQGYTVVWSGWDGELLPGDDRLQLHAPVSSGANITGLVRYEIMTAEDVTRVNINREHHGAYRPTAAGLQQATLTWRLRAADQRVPIPREQFQLHVSDVQSQYQGQLPRVELELPAGLRRGYLYELIYEAQEPLVHGVCFAAVRDLIAALKHGEGTGNPLLVDEESPIKRAYGFGVSQSGRFLRELLYSGFNEDEQGRKVFEALMPHVAGAGLGSFNHRFAQPSAYASQHEHHDWPTDRFPFTYAEQRDPRSQREDGILRHAQEQDVVPLVMHTQSSTEYWSRGGSLVHTDPLGQQDANIPDTVRVYAFGGTQHGPAAYPPQPGAGQTKPNPADYRPLLRGLLVALDQWCREGTPPPDSVYPSLEEGTLVDWHQKTTGFPHLPDIRYPEVIYQPALLDLGDRWQSDGIISHQPPVTVSPYQVLVPGCNADGNESGCLLAPEVGVPLATFSGWSLRSREAGAEGELVGLDGSYILLAADEAERQRSGDPRVSLAQRYGSLDKYLDQLEHYCEQMVTQRYLLQEDVPEILKRQRERAAAAFEAQP